MYKINQTFCILVIVILLTTCSSSAKYHSENNQNSNDLVVFADSSYYVRQGKRFYERKDYVSAISSFSDAISSNNMDADAYYYRGIIYFGLGRFSESIDDFNKLLQLQSIQAYQIYDAWMYRSKAYIEVGNIENAINGFTTIISFSIENASVADILGLENSKEYNNTFAEEAYFNRGYCHAILKKHENAIYDFTSAINFNSNNSTYYLNRGTAYYAMGDGNYENAESDLKKSLTINPNLFEANHNLGIVYFNLEKYNDAITVLTKAIELDNNSANAHFYRGMTYVNLMISQNILNDNFIRNALNDLETAVELNPNNNRYRNALNGFRDLF